MPQPHILDYGDLSGFRFYRPLIGIDPREADPLAGASRTCSFCATPLEEVPEVSETAWHDPAAILACPACGWWGQYAVGPNRDGYYEWEHVPAALRTYAASDMDAPIDALRRELSRNPRTLERLHPTRTEELVGSVLGDFMDCEVIHTGRTGDGGIDLLLVQGEREYVVQVKRRGVPGRGEPVSVVREFLGAALLEGHDRGIFVTTATHFTPAARQAATRARSRRLVQKLHLVDRDRFLELLRLVSRKTLPPWKAYYRDVENADFEGPVSIRFHGEHSRCDWVDFDENGNEVVDLARWARGA